MNAFFFILDRITDDIGILSMSFSDTDDFPRRIFGYHNAKSNTHVINAKHLFVGYITIFLYERKNRRDVRQIVNYIPYIRGYPSEVEEAIARNMRQGLNGP